MATKVPGVEGDCTSASFGFFGYAMWNPEETVSISSGLSCFNLPACDVKVKFPDGNAPAFLFVVPTPNGAVQHLIVFGVKIPFQDCG